MLLLYGYCLAILFSIAYGARILAIFSFPAKSHFSCNEAILKSLHAAGHNITLISPFPPRAPVGNYTMIDSSFKKPVLVGQSSIAHFGDMSLNALLHFTINVSAENCDDMMKVKEIQEMLQSKEKLYDIVFIELYFLFECNIVIAEQLGIPVIGTVTTRAWNMADSYIGRPNNPATIPEILIENPPVMTFVQRVVNLWAYVQLKYFDHIVMSDKLHTFYSHYFPRNERFEKKVSLVFYNNHPTISARPSIPNVIEVGGIHVMPAKSLPLKLEKFINEAEHGVILFSLGSVIRSSSLTPEQRTALVQAFAAIPQRVIWKFEDPIEGLSENVLLSEWVPQRDILEHPNVKAFISHCGQSGFYEAVHTGTPVITMPLWADQRANALLLEHLGVAVRLDLKTVTKEKALSSLHAIMDDERYYNEMQQLSQRFKDRPMSPQESIVYWTEYVIRHNGAPHLQTAALDIPLYQFLLLDVIFVLLTASVTVLYLMLCMYKKLKSGIVHLRRSKVVKID